ncbi:MAG: RtcB family protein [Thermoguttaceae bacterium]
MKLTNLSAEPEGKLYSWIPHGLRAEQIVFLPDACPGKAPPPTGTAVLTRQADWRRFAISDCGCGMRFLKSQAQIRDVTPAVWNAIANDLRANKGRLGDLGGGNHFLDALVPTDDPTRVYLLIHTGSREESGLVDNLIDQPAAFDQEFARIVSWAEANRASVQRIVERHLGKLDLVLDRPHNTYEILNDGAVLLRKGSVRVMPGELAIIPSHLSGDVAVVKATGKVGESLFSLSHGTGRTMSRADSKTVAEGFDFSKLRRSIMLPDGIADASLRTEGPFAYRDLDECLFLLEGFVEVQGRFHVRAYMGHL